MSLELSARVTEREFDLDLSVPTGQVVALIGPNGAGKSTALSVISGLLRPDRGHAILDGQALFDLSGPGSERAWTPPHARRVALLAQEPLLFPHLTALDNVAFGPRSTGQSKQDSRNSGLRWLDEVDAREFADRKPAQLSGGQAQRIAVARALAAEPSLLLLDEPMAALDVAVAPALRQMLGRVLAGRTAVLVTHDVLDALLLADRVVVLDDGRVTEDGPTGQVLSRPKSAFAARIAGLNMIRGNLVEGGLRTDDGVLVSGRVDATLDQTSSTEAIAVFRPSAVSIFEQPPGGSPQDVFDVVITELEPQGDRIRVRTGQLNADVTPAAVAQLGLAPGQRVSFVVKANEVDIYPV
ncbi:MAG: ATP-binding cassette domain-containing protein [Nocardioides sp.]|uniref:sulfate/molybdate ABC transporter ATP-binding protein n=1 Tax=Nocardioides sp. TaxID=35761 RepID=UPI0039E64E46